MEHCKKNECGQCEGGMAAVCGMNRCGGHHGMTLLRWFLGLMIIVMVFCLGVKIGEYKQAFEGGDSGYGYSSRMMGGYGYDRPMMYRLYNSDTAPAATLELPVKTK